MDTARASHGAQARLKLALTPLWVPGMGKRLKVAREKQLRTQAELATLLTTPEHSVSQQQVAAVEGGRLDRLDVTWARLEAVLGRHTGYVLIAKDAALYNERLIAVRYFEHRQKTLRKNANPARRSRHA